MAARQFVASLLLLISTKTMAAPPLLYHQDAYESPVSGTPDDLLLLAGYGFAADDTVVYESIRNTGESLVPPERVPVASGPEQGLAPTVSAADVPYALTIKLPQKMVPDQPYALWVRNAAGEWSKGVKINDARPLWLSPAYVFAMHMPANLPRELKIVGRNLQPTAGHSTLVRLVGPQVLTGAAVPSSGTLNHYVTRVNLPGHLAPGRYRVLVNRDGVSWVEIKGESLEVRPEPTVPREFRVDDPQFGGCLPDDGEEDTTCIVRAVAAAALAGGGTVVFGRGAWDLIDGGQPGLVTHEGIVIPAGVNIRGAGSSFTRIRRHPEWSVPGSPAVFTLLGKTEVTDFTFQDLQIYHPNDPSRAFIQLGEDRQRVQSKIREPIEQSAVTDVVISRNTFDKPQIAVSAGGLPINRLMITYNIFGAYSSALELSGDWGDVTHGFELNDSVISHNVFKPGSKIDLIQKTGAVASEIGAGHRLDFSDNIADGASADFLYSPDDAKGWRAAFFWNPSNNFEDVLVSENTATCTGDKIGDGEALAFDNNTNTFGFASAAAVTGATTSSVTVSVPLIARQHNQDVPMKSYYVGHWLQIVSGPGLGQVRKISGYSTDPDSHMTTINVAPEWDVAPARVQSRVTIGREYWQVFVVGNQIDNRQPLCQKSNRSRRSAGLIEMWGQSADSVFAGNHQYDSDGILVQENYGTPEHPCSDCSMDGYFNSFLDIRDNVVDGEYDWSNDCSSSGIAIGVAAAPWERGPPPTVGFGVSVSHNTVRGADNTSGGGIGQIDTWFAGPEPHRWPLSDNTLIHHNSLSDIDGARAIPICGKSRPRIGIAFPDAAVAWRTVLYANSCKHVATPIGAGGVDTVKLCPATVPDSCECPPSTE